MTDTTNTQPPLPGSCNALRIDGSLQRIWTEDKLRAYGDARAAHAVAQCPHALKEKIRSAEARIAELEAQIKAREIVGHMVHGENIATAAFYPLSKTIDAFDAARRWGRSITALVAHPDTPTLPSGTAREITDAEIDAKRLDFVIGEGAFIVWKTRDGSIRQCQLWTQDEDEAYHTISGDERFFNTPREAIDAATALANKKETP